MRCTASCRPRSSRQRLRPQLSQAPRPARLAAPVPAWRPGGTPPRSACRTPPLLLTVSQSATMPCLLRARHYSWACSAMSCAAPLPHGLGPHAAARPPRHTCHHPRSAGYCHSHACSAMSCAARAAAMWGCSRLCVHACLCLRCAPTGGVKHSVSYRKAKNAPVLHGPRARRTAGAACPCQAAHAQITHPQVAHHVTTRQPQALCQRTPLWLLVWGATVWAAAQRPAVGGRWRMAQPLKVVRSAGGRRRRRRRRSGWKCAAASGSRQMAARGWWPLAVLNMSRRGRGFSSRTWR